MDNIPFPSFSQLLFALPSTNPDYIPTQSFRSHTEQGHILDADIISRHLSDDLKRASWLESFIAPYLADLDDVRQRIAYQKCLLSPIRRVPLEILQSIFLACLPQGFVEADPNAAPMLLCQVCKYWRDVVLTLPPLWASFKVRRSSTGTCGPALPLAELWLERSNPAPLSICLPVDSDRRCEPESDDVQPLMLLFLRHLSRWKAVHMCLRDLLFYETHVPGYRTSTILEDVELCFSLDSYGSMRPGDLGPRTLRDMVPHIWTSSARLHSLTLNATTTINILPILRTCPNICDCEFHITDGRIRHSYESPEHFPDEKLTLPLLHTLNIRARTTFFNLLNAITTPVLCALTIKGEKRWDQTSFEGFFKRSSCSIEEFSMVNITIGPKYLRRTLELIGTSIKILRIHSYPQGTERPISETILRGIASHLLVPNLEVLNLGCDSLIPEHHPLFKEMVLSRLDDELVSRLGLGSGPSHSSTGTSDSRLSSDTLSSSHLNSGSSQLNSGSSQLNSDSSSRLGSGQLRRVCLSPDRDTAHMHGESLAFIEALGRAGIDVADDPVWRAYRIDGWFHGIRVWPGSDW